jgi:hypothetical protein
MFQLCVRRPTCGASGQTAGKEIGLVLRVEGNGSSVLACGSEPWQEVR